MQISLPLLDGTLEKFDFGAGKTVVFVGANGAGKTRLGVWLEEHIPTGEVHRVSAHRSLIFADDVQIIEREKAENRLLYGIDNGSVGHRRGQRWGNKPATHLLTDFEHVLRALYAEQTDVAVSHLEAHSTDRNTVPPETKLRRLKIIWDELLPHRALVIRGATVKIRPAVGGDDYRASELSTGERVIFYLIAQALLAPLNSILIVDEPELHIHKSILSDVWDRIEGSRTDLGIIYITHDLEFATTRHSELKFAVVSYSHDSNTPTWSLERIDPLAGLSEEMVSKILGSRRPILFVEGDLESLDAVIYRRVYTDRTVIPTGGHDQVIGSVAAFNSHNELHRVGCCGLIDRDEPNPELNAASNVFRLQVSEIENLLLLPQVFYQLARSLSYSRAEAKLKTSELITFILQTAGENKELYGARSARRTLDRQLKSVGLKSKTAEALAADFVAAIAAIDPRELANTASASLAAHVAAGAIYDVLALYDDKSLLAEAAKSLQMNKRAFEEYIARLLSSQQGRPLLRALRKALPKLP